MRVNEMTSPLPVIATVLPARNRRVTRGRAEPGTLPSPAYRDAGAGRAGRHGNAGWGDELGHDGGSSCCAKHDPALGSSGVGSAYTAAPGNWAPASRPVRGPGGVYTGRRYDVARKEGAQDGDSRSARTGTGTGRRWRGIPGAGTTPARSASTP